MKRPKYYWNLAEIVVRLNLHQRNPFGKCLKLLWASEKKLRNPRGHKFEHSRGTKQPSENKIDISWWPCAAVKSIQPQCSSEPCSENFHRYCDW